MAGNQSLIAAVFASLLLHASALYAPINQLGERPRPVVGGVFEATLADKPSAPVDRLATIEEVDVVASNALAPESFIPPERQATPNSVAASEDGQVRGTDVSALASFDIVSVYFLTYELTKGPVLRKPVLQDVADSDYPASESVLAVRVNEQGEVDDVITLYTSNPEVAQVAVAAFLRDANYYPGKMGETPVKSEIRIKVTSTARQFEFSTEK